MREVQQTIFEPPLGDCFRACIASILDLEIDDVPNFNEHGDDWWCAFGKWLASRGMVAFEVWIPDGGDQSWCSTVDKLTDVFAIVTFDSPRGDWLHCAVADATTGVVVWDPFPGATKGWPLDKQPKAWTFLVRLADAKEKL